MKHSRMLLPTLLSIILLVLLILPASTSALSTAMDMPDESVLDDSGPASVTPQITTAEIEGQIREVNCEVLEGVIVELYRDDTLVESTANDWDGRYDFTVYPPEGSYEIVANKWGFREQRQWVEVEMEEQYTLDFRGDHGLIPNDPDLFYVLDCIDLWLYPPGDECGLTLFRVLDVIDAWLYPVDAEIVLYEHTKEISEEEADNITGLSEDRDRILFGGLTDFVAGIQVGDVLVSEHPVPGAEQGLLKKVTGVTTLAGTLDEGGVIEIEVEPATLEDAIEQGVISVTQTIPFEDLLSNALWADGVEVTQGLGAPYPFVYYPAEGVTIEGYLLVVGDVQLSIKAGFWRGLQEFRLVFSPGLEMEATLTVEKGVSWEKDWEVPLLPLAPIPIWGPVTLEPEISLVIGTEGSIDAFLEATVTYDRAYDVGVRYRDGKWSPEYNVRGEGGDLRGPYFEGSAEALVYGGFDLSLTAGVPRVATAGIGTKLLGNIEAKGEIQNLPWRWQYDVELYMSAEVYANLYIVGIANERWSAEPWESERYPLFYGASGRVTNEEGHGLEDVRINFSGGVSSDAVTDPEGYWSKDLLRGHVAATPQKSGFRFEPGSASIGGSRSNLDFLAIETEEPTVTIVSPAHNSHFTHGETIYFEGEAEGQDGDPIFPWRLIWTSDIDDELWIGREFELDADELQDGYHTITLEATDKHGTNGTASISIVVGPLPDLTVTSVTTPESLVYPGETVSVEFTVENLGGPVAIEFVNRVFLSRWPYGPAHAILGNFPMTMNGSTSKTDTVEVTIPQVAGGEWYVAVFTDANDVIQESNELNNINSTQVTIPDVEALFEIVAFDVPATAATGQVITIHYEVENKGEHTGTRMVKLTIEDSEETVVYQRMGNETLEPGEVFSEDIQYAFDTPDEYTVTLDTEYDQETATIQIGERLEIWDWHDLHATRENLDGYYVLMNDLDSTTAGYDELAGPTANDGKGWEPIGSPDDRFTGHFLGQGYEIGNLFVDRPEESYVGLFGYVGSGGIVENVGVLNADVTGASIVGGLTGYNSGTVTNSYSTGTVKGNSQIGGLVGRNGETVSSAYATGSVIGDRYVGGLVGYNAFGSVSNSYSTGDVTGEEEVGGLVGWSWGTISDSYATGSVTGERRVGGLIGANRFSLPDYREVFSGIAAGDDDSGGLAQTNSYTLSNSYATGSVVGVRWVGGLVGYNTRTVGNSYASGSVIGQEDIGGLVGENRSTVSNSFWDVETSGMTESDGGTGKTTTEMQSIATFTDTDTEGLDEPWDIIAVSPGETNPVHIWNIVDGQTYPFLTTLEEEDGDSVYFACPNLEAAIREAIEKPTGDIYPSDLEGLTYLYAVYRSITDLTGLEYCSGLTELWLYNNQISDVSPLAGLTGLEWLYLYYNQISDISPLTGLTNLTILHLYNNQISDISPLTGLTNLTELYLKRNQISDISPLAGLTSLTKLWLSHNQISDISPLAGLTGLEWLYLTVNQISDISPLAGLTNLPILNLYDNQISDISPLEGLTGLTGLSLAYNQISDISPLTGLTSLTILHLYNNQISDISPLEGLTNLTWLTLYRNQISDIRPLVDNSGLGEGNRVDLRENPLSEQSINEYIPALRARGVTVGY